MSTDRTNDDEFRDWDAAYVLGMLSSEDRRAYERHLATCASCSTALAELAGLPGILSSLTTEEVVEFTTVTDAASLRDTAHEPGLVHRLAAGSARRRRRNRWLIGATSVLAAAALVTGSFFIGSAITAPPTPPAAIAMSPLVANTISANLTVTPKKWGTRLDWNCSYASSLGADSNLDYDLVVTEKSGKQLVVATWGAYGDQANGLSASTAVAIGDIGSVDIRLQGSSTVLARAVL